MHDTAPVEPPWRRDGIDPKVREAAEEMLAWFRHHYEDPVENCPHESAEGGYQFIYGGPYDAQEELEAQYGDVHPDETIEMVAQFLSEECYEWSGKVPDGEEP